ncbi:hypothetical protein D3C87_1800010 [compost metagenome]
MGEEFGTRVGQLFAVKQFLTIAVHVTSLVGFAPGSQGEKQWHADREAFAWHNQVDRRFVLNTPELRPWQRTVSTYRHVYTPRSLVPRRTIKELYGRYHVGGIRQKSQRTHTILNQLLQQLF